MMSRSESVNSHQRSRSEERPSPCKAIDAVIYIVVSWIQSLLRPLLGGALTGALGLSVSCVRV